MLPFLVKPLAIIIAIAAIFGYGYHKGLLSGEAEKDKVVAEVSRLGMEAQVHSLTISNQHLKVKQDEVSKLNRRLTTANKRYNGLLLESDASRLNVPPVSVTPARTSESASDNVSRERYNQLGENYNQLASDCTDTTLKYLTMQDMWNRLAEIK